MTDRGGRDGVALLFRHSDDGEAIVVCPTCGSDQTRVFHVGTLVGTNESETGSHVGDAVATGVNTRRRSVVEIVFNCEHCPHHFALVIEQHRGRHLVDLHENVPNFTD